MNTDNASNPNLPEGGWTQEEFDRLEERVIERSAKRLYDHLTGMTQDDEFFKASRTEKVVLAVESLEERAAAKKLFEEQQTRADLTYINQVPSLAEILALPEDPVVSRIQDMLVVGHNTTVAAPAKTGKTVLQANRVRSYVDGTPFLGKYDVVTPVTGNVAVWNYELSENQMHSWFRRLGIKNADKVFVHNLRGKGYMLQDDTICELAINWLRQHEVEVWEIDPLQAALRGSVNDDAVAAQWIQNVEQVKHEAGVKDLVLTVHMGHAASYKDADRATERAIGSARWMGWPDNMWTYVRGDEGINYLRAQGRDVEVAEFSVDWNPETYELTHRGEKSSRYDARKGKVWTEVRRVLTTKAEASNDEVIMAAGTASEQKTEARRLLKVLKESGLAEDFTGAKGQTGPGKKMWRLTEKGKYAVSEAVNAPPKEPQEPWINTGF